MDNKMKLRIAALKRLADQGLNPEEYMEGLKEIKSDEGKALMQRRRSPASADFDDNIDMQMLEEKQRLVDLENEGKTEEQLEREAYDKLFEERIKRGMLTKPFERFEK